MCENTLKQFGFNPHEASRRQQMSKEAFAQELHKNLESYTNEVLENQPVSLLYHYWFKNDGSDTLYTNPNGIEINNAELQVDPRERGGCSITGLKKLGSLLHDNPNCMTYWYSPPGPASFEKKKDNPYSHINYDYGQLYFQYYDRNKVNAVAVKVSPQHEEDIIKFLFPQYSPLAFGSEEKRIEYFLTNPQLSSVPPDSFLSYISQIKGGLPVFDRIDPVTKKNTTYVLNEICALINDRLSEKHDKNHQDPSSFSYKESIETQQDIMRAYLATIHRFMERNNIKETSLSGSCGGSLISSSEVDMLFSLVGQDRIAILFKDMTSLYSSGYRSITQQKKWEYHDGHCVVCQKQGKVGPCDICQACEEKL